MMSWASSLIRRWLGISSSGERSLVEHSASNLGLAHRSSNLRGAKFSSTHFTLDYKTPDTHALVKGWTYVEISAHRLITCMDKEWSKLIRKFC